MLETVQALRETFAKKRAAVTEGFDLGRVLANAHFSVNSDPFPHIIADDVFTPEAFAGIEGSFKAVLERGLSEEVDPARFSPFLGLKKMGKEWEYDGYLYVPPFEENGSLQPFFSLEWNLLFSRLFGQPTDWTTSLAFHHHTPGDRTGFVHNDYTMKHFSPDDRAKNGVLHREYLGPVAGIPLYHRMRVIALLLYLGPSTEIEGGGTGLYGSRGTKPVKLVEPKPNRLLAFEISPKSFHAFQENLTERNAIIQWFHMSPAWCKRKYGYI